MRYKETGFDVAAVGVFPLLIEDFTIEVNVIVVDGIVEGDGDHLRNVLAVGAGRPDFAQVTGHLGAVLGTEAVGELANGGITWWCPIRIGIDI